MGVGILAPVPAVHLKSALDTCAAPGRVIDLVHLAKEDRIAVTDLTSEDGHKPFVKKFIPLRPVD